MPETYIKNCFRIMYNLLDAPISEPSLSDELFLKNVLSRLNKIDSHRKMLRQCENALLDELAVNRKRSGNPSYKFRPWGYNLTLYSKATVFHNHQHCCNEGCSLTT